uniref:Uncharacterized protein n=1 Tax=Arundo donax TaxID=35708 RepID=A0A0A8Y1L2_ARUDO
MMVLQRREKVSRWCSEGSGRESPIDLFIRWLPL